MSEAVLVTGVGAFTSLGPTAEAQWQAICEGRDGFRPAPAGRLTTPSFARFAAAWLEEPRFGGAVDACAVIALTAAREAFRDARLEGAGVAPERMAIVFGSSAGGLLSRSEMELSPSLDAAARARLLDRSLYETQTAWVADRLGIAGPRLTVSTACTSSSHAIAHARDLLDDGAADIVLAGGADLVTEEVFAGFAATEAMSEAPCSPFGRGIGMSLGEGAAFVVIERASHAARRGASAYAVLAGSGLSSDAHHATAPDPTGGGMARAMVAALDDAGAAPDEIDYVNAHGTGTEANDAAEARAIERVLGPAAPAVAVGSSKGHVGHTLGAAGAIELVITLLAMRASACPPSLRSRPARAFAPAGLVGGGRPREASIRCAIKTGAAFGGTNAALVVRSPEAATRTSTTTVASAPEGPGGAIEVVRGEPVVVVGSGVVGAHGTACLDDALRAEVPFFSAPDVLPRHGALPAVVGRRAVLDAARLARGVDPRGLDRTSRLLIASCALALSDAGLAAVGSLRDRLGLFVAATMVPWDSADELWDSVRQRGFERISAPAFSRIVMNAAAGATSRALSLRGPTSVLVGRTGTTLSALSLASRALATRRDADAICVASAHELSRGGLEDYASRDPRSTVSRPHRPFALYEPEGVESASEAPPVPGEAAASFVLTSARFAANRGLPVRAVVAGSAIDGPLRLASSITRALAAARCAPTELDAIYGSVDGRRESSDRELAALSASLGALAHDLPLACASPLLGVTDDGDALALAAALEAIRTGRAHPTAGGRCARWNLSGRWHRPTRTVLVIGAHERSGSAATVLRASALG